ncbi:MAG: NPCBM/NEW2 domain-containing protein [Planctomycetes bacterium]|nr:NPCBM/NEW2 domain-containing protein [Planctomycetota bacterium]
MELIRQDYEQLEVGQSVIKTPLVIGQKRFQRGLGTHSVGHLRIRSPKPLARFSASIGVDHNERTSGGRGSVVFVVSAAGLQRYRSPVMHGGEAPEQIDVDLGGATVLDLHIEDAGDGPACDHADWAEARIATADGKHFYLDEIPPRADSRLSRYPFSFLYDGRHCDQLLPNWERSVRSDSVDPHRTRTVTTWLDPQTGLRLRWQVVRFADYPAAEWLLTLQNTGTADTPILERVEPLDVALDGPLGDDVAYRLHRTNGAPSNPTDFEPSVVPMDRGSIETLSGGGGRSSNKDFPFFKIESQEGSLIVAVGWSGQWLAHLACRDDRRLHLTAGLERTHFRLRPGEQVRSPRILLFHQPGDTLHANARFRRLIYQHYAARRDGRRLLPTLYCNTCFTRGGGWLNECNAENQISLIRAYAPMGLEALLTDAGWFEGGWPAGAGNWTPRKDAYPDGMRPVAAAAKSNGMVYGLWFERPLARAVRI